MIRILFINKVPDNLLKRSIKKTSIGKNKSILETRNIHKANIDHILRVKIDKNHLFILINLLFTIILLVPT